MWNWFYGECIHNNLHFLVHLRWKDCFQHQPYSQNILPFLAWSAAAVLNVTHSSKVKHLRDKFGFSSLSKVAFLAIIKIKIFKNLFWEIPGYLYLLNQRKKYGCNALLTHSMWQTHRKINFLPRSKYKWKYTFH